MYEVVGVYILDVSTSTVHDSGYDDHYLRKCDRLFVSISRTSDISVALYRLTIAATMK